MSRPVVFASATAARQTATAAPRATSPCGATFDIVLVDRHAHLLADDAELLEPPRGAGVGGGEHGWMPLAHE
jgi:hypothetical protein